MRRRVARYPTAVMSRAIPEADSADVHARLRIQRRRHNHVPGQQLRRPHGHGYQRRATPRPQPTGAPTRAHHLDRRLGHATQHPRHLRRHTLCLRDQRGRIGRREDHRCRRADQPAHRQHHQTRNQPAPKPGRRNGFHIRRLAVLLRCAPLRRRSPHRSDRIGVQLDLLGDSRLRYPRSLGRARNRLLQPARTHRRQHRTAELTARPRIHHRCPAARLPHRRSGNAARSVRSHTGRQSPNRHARIR